jgi:hypothetical protein
VIDRRELASYPLFQVHLTKEPPDRREHDGVELAQLRSRLDSQQVLEPSMRLASGQAEPAVRKALVLKERVSRR